MFTTGTCPVLCSNNGEYEEGACRCYPGWKGSCDWWSRWTRDPNNHLWLVRRAPSAPSATPSARCPTAATTAPAWRASVSAAADIPDSSASSVSVQALKLMERRLNEGSALSQKNSVLKKLLTPLIPKTLVQVVLLWYSLWLILFGLFNWPLLLNKINQPQARD